MLPIIGAILVLATISTAGISAYYGFVKPMVLDVQDKKEIANKFAERNKLIKSWIDCGNFPGLEGSSVYTVRTSLLKELNVYNTENSFNVIKFVNGPSPAINGERVHNVGLEDVTEITVKNIGDVRLICKDIVVYYVKDRIRLESKVIPKKRVVIVSEKLNIQHKTYKNVIALDFGNYISITEPEMKEYQIHHISFDLQSDKTVPIMINISMKNRDYLFLTCSYKNLLTMSFIDDMAMTGGCVKSSGHVSATIEQRDLSTVNSLPINLRQTIAWILDDTVPTHNGINDITKISITNDGSENINVDEIGIYYFDTVSRFIKYRNLNRTIGIVNPGKSSETDAITIGIEIFEIKIIARSDLTYSRIFIDLYSGVDYRRIETCLFDNIIHLTLFREASVGGLSFPTPSINELTTGNTCNNPFAMNGYCKVSERNLQMQYPTVVSFVSQRIIDIEGMLPITFGLYISELEIYSQETFTLNKITIYYIDDKSQGGIKKKDLVFYLSNDKIPTLNPITITSGISGIALISSIITSDYQIYRIKFSTTNTKFSRFFLKLKTSLREDYVISSCMGTNTFYLDLNGNKAIKIKAVCDINMALQIYVPIKLQNMEFYSIYEPSTTYKLPWNSTKQWHTTGSALIGTEPGNIRNPVTGLYIITITSDISTLTNNYIGIYYKFSSESKLRYKKIDRYLIKDFNLTSGIIESKLSDLPVSFDNDKYILCMDNSMGSYEIYEIEIEMNNLDWSQVYIGLINQSGNSYKTVACMRNNKINIPIFGKTIDTTIIRNLLQCTNVVIGQAYTDITLTNIKFNTDPYYEHCNPLPLMYKMVPGILGEVTSKKGFSDIVEIDMVNIGDIKIELTQLYYYYTTSTTTTVARQSFTIQDNKGINIAIPAKLYSGIQYKLIAPTISTLYIQRLEFTTDITGISQLELAVHRKERTTDSTAFLQANGSDVIKSALFAFCVSNNIISLNFL